MISTYAQLSLVENEIAEYIERARDDLVHHRYDAAIHSLLCVAEFATTAARELCEAGGKQHG